MEPPSPSRSLALVIISGFPILWPVPPGAEGSFLTMAILLPNPDEIIPERKRRSRAMLERILTGGQTGADQGGWRAARGADLATGGRMPRGFATEDGPRPEFAGLYGAVEDESADPAARTVAPLQAAEGTLISAGAEPSAGTALTIAACREAGRPYLVLPARFSAAGPDPAEVAAW